jgi:starvation-inducible DNA-binding protein
MRNFYWNLVGPSFVEVHRFIEDLYDQLVQDIDIVAEQINQLRQYAYGSMAEFLQHSSLKGSTGGKKEQHLVINELAADNDTSARKIRELIALIEEKYEDSSTVDILTDLIRNHEKNAWMLRR